MDKEKYREFCNQEPGIPIFSRDWWLDAVCGDKNWDVRIVEKGGEIKASLPYFLRKSKGFNHINMPLLTQTMGPYLKHSNSQKASKKLSFEKKMMSELISYLPAYDSFSQNFNCHITNWLPLYWLGFKQSTRYTYVIDELNDLDAIYKKFDSNIKTDIKKAQKEVSVISNEDIEKFYEINSLTFARQKMNMPYSIDFIKKLDSSCKERNCRKIFFAIDKDENIHAAIYIVWDKKRTYYLLGGGDPKYRNSGATSLLLWEAIQFSSNVSEVFDFEGSMMQPVEKFVRAFGTTQKPYFNITKVNSKILKLINFLRDIR